MLNAQFRWQDHLGLRRLATKFGLAGTVAQARDRAASGVNRDGLLTISQRCAATRVGRPAMTRICRRSPFAARTGPLAGCSHRATRATRLPIFYAESEGPSRAFGGGYSGQSI